jgi:hypothetical protein
MKINTGKVIIGGVIAGIVMLIIDFLSQKFWLGAQATAQFDAYKAGSSAAMMSGTAAIMYPINEILLGIALVWVYAAIRPRFGPGPRTAVYAALPLWVASCIAYYGYLSMGMMTPGLWWTFGIVGLVTMILATIAGAKFYAEDAGT